MALGSENGRVIVLLGIGYFQIVYHKGSLNFNADALSLW